MRSRIGRRVTLVRTRVSRPFESDAMTVVPELRTFAATLLADYKVPSDVWFLPVLPKGVTGKVDRRALAESIGSGAPASTAAGAG